MLLRLINNIQKLKIYYSKRNFITLRTLPNFSLYANIDYGYRILYDHYLNIESYFFTENIDYENLPIEIIEKYFSFRWVIHVCAIDTHASDKFIERTLNNLLQKELHDISKWNNPVLLSEHTFYMLYLIPYISSDALAKQFYNYISSLITKVLTVYSKNDKEFYIIRSKYAIAYVMNTIKDDEDRLYKELISLINNYILQDGGHVSYSITQTFICLENLLIIHKLSSSKYKKELNIYILRIASFINSMRDIKGYLFNMHCEHDILPPRIKHVLVQVEYKNLHRDMRASGFFTLEYNDYHVALHVGSSKPELSREIVIKGTKIIKNVVNYNNQWLSAPYLLNSDNINILSSSYSKLHTDIKRRDSDNARAVSIKCQGRYGMKYEQMLNIDYSNDTDIVISGEEVVKFNKQATMYKLQKCFILFVIPEQHDISIISNSSALIYTPAFIWRLDCENNHSLEIMTYNQYDTHSSILKGIACVLNINDKSLMVKWKITVAQLL